MVRKVLFLSAFTITISISSIAQNANIGGAFPTLDVSGSFNEKWTYSFYYFGAFSLISPEISSRSDHPHLNALYLEQAIHFKINKALTFTGSYVYERQNPFRNTYRNENRFYLQATYKHSILNKQITQRIRYDGRYIQNRLNGDTPYTNRIRYLLGINSNLRKESDKWYLAAYNEFFFNLDKSSDAVYGENWAFAGLGLKTGQQSKIELGPLYIFWVINPRKDLINFYYLQLTWVFQLK
jgi:hypothetical protein